MEFDGYRGADDVEEEVRNVGEGTDLFTHYAIGLPILMRIFSYLDVHSLRRVVLVNRAWYGHNKDRRYMAGQTNGVWLALHAYADEAVTESHDVERSLHVCDYLSYVVQTHIKEIKLKDQAYIAAKKNKACPPQKNASLFTSDPLVEYNPTDNTIDYVNATIDLLRQYLKLQAARQQQKALPYRLSLRYAASKRMGLNDKEEQERRAFLTQLLKIMNTQLRDTILALSDILSGRTKWNSNFEIFELSIRRYYEQLKVLFPAKPTPPGPTSASPARHRMRASPTAIISDPQARLIWQMRVGSDKYSCEFERFYELVIEREFLSVTSEKMKQDLYYYFNYFLNFPRDNMVTTYKWEVLTRLFGPYHEFIENFSNYVLGSGFLGLINRHHAEEILENHPEAVLMRFSRTYPTCLAFSFRKKDGKYDHYTNNPVWHGYPPFKGTRPKEETKSNIPIKEFLEKVFLQKGYELLPLRIDGKSVAAKGTASKYAQVADPYLDTDNFEAEEESSDRHCAPASHPTSSASWSAYKNSAASPSSSFSEQSGFGGGAYLADSDSSPSTARKGSPQGEESQSPWSSPLPKSFAPASPSTRRQTAARQPTLDNYVEDSIMNDSSPASLLPPPSSFTSTSISPSSSPSRSTGFRDNQFSSSPSSPSPYSDVFEYQRQNGPQQQRERGGSNGGSSGGGTRPVPIVQTTFHGSTTSPSPQEPCFYLDGASVKEELERNDPSSSRSVARQDGTSPIKSKRAESFQENYLDDVVFVEEEDDRDDPAVRRSGRNPSPPVAMAAATTPALREYAAGQRATADPRQRQTVTVAVTTTTGVSGVYIGGGEELATSTAQQGGFMMGGHAGSGSDAARGKAEREERERREKRREERERAKKEFELNACAYERDGDIHFADEDEAFSVSTPAKNDDAFETSKADQEYDHPERYATASAPQSSSLFLAKQKAADELVDDSMLAAILGQQQQGDAYASSISDQTREAREQQEREQRRREREEKRREKEERRREKEERRKRKEERRAKKEEKRVKAQEEFAAAATSYSADRDSYGGGASAESISSGYFAKEFEDEILPVHSPRRSDSAQDQQHAQWDEYFLDEQKPGKKLEQASAPSQSEERGTEVLEVDDEAMMAAILGESGVKQPPAKAKEQAPAAEGVSPYDEPFDDSFEEAAKGQESESESESEGEQEREREREKAEERKRRDEEENERARQRREQEMLATKKKNEEKERKEKEEQRAQLEEKKTAEARQKEGFVLTYAELTSTERELLPRYVDRSKLESYLSDQEFEMVFGCSRNVFYTYKVWRQQQLKKNAGLF